VINVYTDGGCSGNPGPGGWAYIIIQTGAMGKEEKIENLVPLAENWGAEKGTTNNRMELQAVIKALEFLNRMPGKTGQLTIFTDSQYVQKGMTLWIKDWKSRNWKTSAKDPVKNQDLWQRLDALSGEFTITWTWVKGHAGNLFNERCDELTQKAIASL